MASRRAGAALRGPRPGGDRRGHDRRIARRAAVQQRPPSEETTAVAAGTLGLPGKDQAARRCKDKATMRRALAAAGLDPVRAVTVDPGATPTVPADLFPAVLKPRDGVASEDAYLVTDRREPAAQVTAIRRRRPGGAHRRGGTWPASCAPTTLGDSGSLTVLGGWRTGLGPPPTFTGVSLDWAPPPPAHDARLRAARRARRRLRRLPHRVRRAAGRNPADRGERPAHR
ncbi:hypothetical protein V2I01_25675 [Micromonospora sp. BRA006-A]|nr:hypothetical protein [Micromonospora sp. BRA006-A]